MATYLDELRRIQRELRHQIRNDVLDNIRKASNREAIGVSILVVVLLVSPVIILLVRNAAATIQVRWRDAYMERYIKHSFCLVLQMYALNLSQKAKELKKEKRKSDTLLYQMLPLSVATQLKQTQKVN